MFDLATAIREEANIPKRTPLSEREKSLLRLFCIHGYCNKELGRAAALSEATIKVHMKSMLRKVRVQNRVQLALWGVQNGYGVGHETA